MFSHLPQLNSIRVFDSAARLLSFKAAAEELNVTPTAVSHQIRALEEKLGTLLFERKIRAILLTPEGKKLARVACHSLQEIADVLEEISDNQTVLTVSTTASFAAQWLVPKLDGFRQLHSDINVVIKTGQHLEDLQKDRRIDLAIRYGEFDSQVNNATKLVTERVGMYATKQYLQDFPIIEEARLIETRWQNPSLQPITWKQFFQNKKTNNMQLDIRSFDQEHHVIQAALAGQGIALVSSLLVQTALQQGWLKQHHNGEFLKGLTYYVLTPSHLKSSRKVTCFCDWLQNELKEHA
ncbi:LysR substrate-binding domain-containing protein [Motilimonas pumila]|uniref:LysR family transcriptional regulator n=1 Tax=Motilimonas pumila TaxID=2303987 RepID=A0A418Y9B1_9GAMM|nr:LysR substrate-binding domain-containing protein [Motilimonas pumila]RJG36920.1 LysR family transcriptional regulator [Motilimonas pumila]